MGTGQVLDQEWLVAHVTENDDRVAVARLEHAAQGDRLLGPAVCVSENHVIASLARLERDRFDRTGEERVDDLADDHPEKHRLHAPQPTRQ